MKQTMIIPHFSCFVYYICFRYNKHVLSASNHSSCTYRCDRMSPCTFLGQTMVRRERMGGQEGHNLSNGEGGERLHRMARRLSIRTNILNQLLHEDDIKEDDSVFDSSTDT